MTEKDILNKIKSNLEAGKLASTTVLTDEEKASINDLFLLTSKVNFHIWSVFLYAFYSFPHE